MTSDAVSPGDHGTRQLPGGDRHPGGHGPELSAVDPRRRTHLCAHRHRAGHRSRQLQCRRRCHRVPDRPGTAPSQAAGCQVAYEVDRIDEAFAQGWSVLLRGHARTVTDPDEARRLDRGRGIQHALGGWAARPVGAHRSRWYHRRRITA
ncbi:pyridoxamine 5'-phosphate oxidase family protein [Streptomyces sp. NPDC048581]|uniref:pyridoxamine 5'-phosphate oxidase family protein n=1 Tax=unclassified Streptomyces TaxID=2593676 RepID=UPI0037158AD3